MNSFVAVFAHFCEGFMHIRKLSRMHVDCERRPFIINQVDSTYVLVDPFSYPTSFLSFYPFLSIEKTMVFKMRFGIEEKHCNGLALSVPSYNEIYEQNCLVLHLISDLSDVSVGPMQNVVFVCRLSSITDEHKLRKHFSNCGVVTYCQIIRDPRTDISLGYGFMTFDTIKASEMSYLFLNGSVLDGSSLRVDFYQS